MPETSKLKDDVASAVDEMVWKNPKTHLNMLMNSLSTEYVRIFKLIETRKKL